MDFAIAPYIDFQPSAECIHAGHADAVQAARDFVAIAVELSARVQGGQDHFDGRFFFRGMHINRDAAPVVMDRDRPVGVYRDLNPSAMTGQCFINTVVYDLKDAVVKPTFSGVSDIHRGSFSNRLDSFQNRDVCCVVFWSCFRLRHTPRPLYK